MRKESIASIWLGYFKSESDLCDYVKQRYSECGNVSSQFMNDFQIDYYDHDFEESYFKIGVSEKSDLLEPFSYSSSFIEQVNQLNWSKYNAAIILYDFEYGNSVGTNPNVFFVGSYEYRK